MRPEYVVIVIVGSFTTSTWNVNFWLSSPLPHRLCMSLSMKSISTVARPALVKVYAKGLASGLPSIIVTTGLLSCSFPIHLVLNFFPATSVVLS